MNTARRVWRVATPLVLVVCGTLMVVSAVDSQGTDLRPGRYRSYAAITAQEVSNYDGLQRRLTALQDDIADLTAQVSDDSVREAQGQVAALAGPAGFTAVSGEGLSITLSDAPEELIDSSTIDPNLQVVHQQDIQAVVNALWAGGAEAVTIAGQRIISTTGIKCSGSTVQLQGVPYPQPYVIEAVGDPVRLAAALDADDYVALYRDQAEDPDIGIGWDLHVDADILAPAYTGVTAVRYASLTAGQG